MILWKIQIIIINDAWNTNNNNWGNNTGKNNFNIQEKPNNIKSKLDWESSGNNNNNWDSSNVNNNENINWGSSNNDSNSN